MKTWEDNLLEQIDRLITEKTELVDELAKRAGENEILRRQVSSLKEELEFEKAFANLEVNLIDGE